jgi:hypothetical protein
MQRLSVVILYKTVSRKMADRPTYVKTVYIIYAFVHSVPCWSQSDPKTINCQLWLWEKPTKRKMQDGPSTSLANRNTFKSICFDSSMVEIRLKAFVSTHLWQKHTRLTATHKLFHDYWGTVRPIRWLLCTLIATKRWKSYNLQYSPTITIGDQTEAICPKYNI